MKTYRNNNLFKCVPGRFHKSFPGFINEINTKKINDLKSRLRQYSLNIDKELDLIPEDY